LSQTESLVLVVSCVLSLGSVLWSLGRKQSTDAIALGESVWALVAAAVVLAIAATIWFGV